MATFNPDYNLETETELAAYAGSNSTQDLIDKLQSKINSLNESNPTIQEKSKKRKKARNSLLVEQTELDSDSNVEDLIDLDCIDDSLLSNVSASINANSSEYTYQNDEYLQQILAKTIDNSTSLEELNRYLDYMEEIMNQDFDESIDGVDQNQSIHNQTDDYLQEQQDI